MKRYLLVTIVTVLTPLFAQAQDTSAPYSAVPQIAIVGRGEVKVSPDRASIHISVQTRAVSAAGAASENAAKQQSVLNALRGLGLTNDQLSTLNYSVYPEQRYQEGK